MGFLIVVLVLLCLSVLMWVASPGHPERVRPPQGRREPGRKDLKKRAAAEGPEFQYRLGMACLEESDERGGFKLLLKAAEGGIAAAQDAVGLMYELGRGIAKSEAEAARWYEKAAIQGFADSEVHLGYLFALGRGVDRDYGKASEWFERAAEADSLDGKNSLAWLLATCPDDSVRDARRAVGVLAPVVYGGERHPVLLDTLAAAYAEEGLFSRAIELAKEALGKTDQASEPLLYGQISQRLLRYESGRPWRELTDGAPGPAGEAAAPAMGAPASEAREEKEGPSGDLLWKDEDRNEAVSPPGEEREETPAEGPKPEEAAPQSPLDYIAEKFRAVEDLMRPLAQESETPATEEDQASLEHRKAADFSRSLVEALINDEHREVYAKMERAFQNAVPESQMRPMLEEMYATYGGKPLQAELKAEETGYRLYAGEKTRIHKFWYALATAGQELGVYSLFVEVHPEEGRLACSTFFIVPPGAESQ